MLYFSTLMGIWGLVNQLALILMSLDCGSRKTFQARGENIFVYLVVNFRAEKLPNLYEYIIRHRCPTIHHCKYFNRPKIYP